MMFELAHLFSAHWKGAIQINDVRCMVTEFTPSDSAQSRTSASEKAPMKRPKRRFICQFLWWNWNGFRQTTSKTLPQNQKIRRNRQCNRWATTKNNAIFQICIASTSLCLFRIRLLSGLKPTAPLCCNCASEKAYRSGSLVLEEVSANIRHVWVRKDDDRTL